MNKKSGKVEYHVTALNVAGQVQKPVVFTLKELDTLVAELNADPYWSVQKIDKFKRYTDFVYDKEILQSPLHFQLEGVTEIENINTENIGVHAFNFMLKAKCLSNIKRVESKIVKEPCKSMDWWYDLSDSKTDELILKYKLRKPISAEAILKVYNLENIVSYEAVFSSAKLI